MEELIKFQQEQIQALQSRNAYLENELSQAKDLFQSLINDWDVKDAEVLQLDVATKVFDEAFQNPINQLNDLTDGLHRK
jgi:hypothetical protein